MSGSGIGVWGSAKFGGVRRRTLLGKFPAEEVLPLVSAPVPGPRTPFPRNFPPSTPFPHFLTPPLETTHGNDRNPRKKPFPYFPHRPAGPARPFPYYLQPPTGPRQARAHFPPEPSRGAHPSATYRTHDPRPEARGDAAPTTKAGAGVVADPRLASGDVSPGSHWAPTTSSRAPRAGPRSVRGRSRGGVRAGCCRTRPAPRPSPAHGGHDAAPRSPGGSGSSC